MIVSAAFPSSIHSFLPTASLSCFLSLHSFLPPPFLFLPSLPSFPIPLFLAFSNFIPPFLPPSPLASLPFSPPPSSFFPPTRPSPSLFLASSNFSPPFSPPSLAPCLPSFPPPFLHVYIYIFGISKSRCYPGLHRQCEDHLYHTGGSRPVRRLTRRSGFHAKTEGNF